MNSLIQFEYFRLLLFIQGAKFSSSVPVLPAALNRVVQLLAEKHLYLLQGNTSVQNFHVYTQRVDRKAWFLNRKGGTSTTM